MQKEKGCPWTSAIVVSPAGPRSYLVKADNGVIYRRNRSMLRPTSETPTGAKDNTFVAYDDIDIPTAEISEDLASEVQAPAITRSGRVSRPPIRYPCSEF